jgi:hypothetical protein
VAHKIAALQGSTEAKEAATTAAPTNTDLLPHHQVTAAQTGATAQNEEGTTGSQHPPQMAATPSHPFLAMAPMAQIAEEPRRQLAAIPTYLATAQKDLGAPANQMIVPRVVGAVTRVTLEKDSQMNAQTATARIEIVLIEMTPEASRGNGGMGGHDRVVRIAENKGGTAGRGIRIFTVDDRLAMVIPTHTRIWKTWHLDAASASSLNRSSILTAVSGCSAMITQDCLWLAGRGFLQ